MEAFILGNGSICHLLQHSKDFQTRFNKHVQELDGHPVHGPVAGAVKLWASVYGCPVCLCRFCGCEPNPLTGHNHRSLPIA